MVTEDPAPDQRAGQRRLAPRWVLFIALALVVLAVDQLTKRWVDSSFGVAWIQAPRAGFMPPTPVLDDLVRIAKSYNDGGLFGLFGTSAQILALASLAVIALIVVYEVRSGPRAPLVLTICLGLLLGGALGNLFDRLRLGYVIDFVDMGVGSIRWYTFNVADASISLAIVGLVALALLGDRIEATRRPRARLPEAVDR